VLGATGVLALAQVALALPSTSLAAVLVAVWTVADRRERRVSLQAAGLVALPLVVLVTATAQDRVDALVLALALLSAAWALGAASRSRRQVLDALRERADRLEDERVARAAAAVSEERLRILREMHDGLGHALTVIAVQADAAGAVLDTDPGRSRAAVAEVADVARSALAELRGIVHAGRHPPPPDLAGWATSSPPRGGPGRTSR
jgi:signal transduction histidine kinase